MANLTIWTVGHSTRPIEDFIALLKAHGIRQLVDVRTVPRSRHNPQFDRANLPASLEQAGVRYSHLPALGGLRKARPDSVNSGWRNASFRGYADHMQTPEFEEALLKLMDLAREAPTTVMCAEAVPWRCHRSLIGDALLARSVNVLDIMSAAEAKPHTLTPFARVDGVAVTYPKPSEAGDANFKLEFDER